MSKRSASRSAIDASTNSASTPGPRGSILILALWTLSLLAVFAVILGSSVRQRMVLVDRLDSLGKLRFISEAGVRRAVAQLKSALVDSTYQTLADPWSNNPETLKDVSLGKGEFSVYYDYFCDPSRPPELRYGLIDEEQKININKTDRTVLERLLMIVLGMDEMEAQELAASIIDWRDGDEELSIPLGSAESSYYQSLPYPYEAKNNDFEVMDELLLVKGINKDIFEKLERYVTIYGSGKVNINTAPRPVLLAVGLRDDMVNDIISFRNGKDKVMGTADDGVFDSPSNIVPRLSQYVNLSVSDIASLGAIADLYLATSSSAFTMYSAARLRNKKYTMTTKAAVDKNGKILYWREF